MGQIQGQGRSEESPLHTSYGRNVCLWPHCVGSEFPEPLWPWLWGRALWMTYSSQSARRQQVEHFSPNCCWRGKSFQAFSRWPLRAMGTLHCQARWPLFMAHVLEVSFRKKLFTATEIDILSFIRQETICPCESFCRGSTDSQGLTEMGASTFWHLFNNYLSNPCMCRALC